MNLKVDSILYIHVTSFHSILSLPFAHIFRNILEDYLKDNVCVHSGYMQDSCVNKLMKFQVL